MDKPAPRHWDPSAPSLLWAHAIRREHVHLVNQVDSARADHASTLDTVNKLQTRVEDLHQQTDQTRTHYEQANARYDTLTDDVERQIHAVLDRLAVLEADNAQLRTRLERVEQECAARAVECTTHAERVHARGESLGVRAGGMDLCSDSRMRAESDIPVPDSMPGDGKKTSGLLLRRGSIRGLSDTTWGSSEYESLVEDDKGMADPPSNGTRDSVLRQNGRSLVEYLAVAGGVRLLTWDETAMIREFIAGLDDPTMKGKIERRLCEMEWTWGCLTAIVGEVARRAEPSIGGVEGDDVTGNDDDKGQNVVKQKQTEKKRKQRRFIPIIPVDEEDLVVLSTMA